MRRVSAFAVLLAAAGTAAIALWPATASARPTVQVQIESRFVEVTKASFDDLGFTFGRATETVTCPPGSVALSAGDSTRELGLAATAFPLGPRAWSFSLTNANLDAALDALVTVACARTLEAPKLRVATGTRAVAVPPAEASGTGLEPGSVAVTGTCAPGSRPTGAGVGGPDAGSVGVVMSMPLGGRRWRVEVENSAPTGASVTIGLRCVAGPDDFRIRLLPVVDIPLDAAPGPGSYAEEAGTRKCPKGTLLVGGGFRVGEDAYQEALGPTLARIPVLGYLFRNGSQSARRAELVVICTPRLLHGTE